jgi:hypothetical protein
LIFRLDTRVAPGVRFDATAALLNQEADFVLATRVTSQTIGKLLRGNVNTISLPTAGVGRFGQYGSRCQEYEEDKSDGDLHLLYFGGGVALVVVVVF